MGEIHQIQRVNICAVVVRKCFTFMKRIFSPLGVAVLMITTVLSANALAASPTEYRPFYLTVDQQLWTDPQAACDTHLPADQAQMVKAGRTPDSPDYPTKLVWIAEAKPEPYCAWYHGDTWISSFLNSIIRYIPYCANNSPAYTGVAVEFQCPDMVNPPDNSEMSNGPMCEKSEPKQPGPPSCGEPINPGNGNMWHAETDYASAAVGGLSLTRTYNSTPYNRDGTIINSFGARWTQEYDSVLRAEGPLGDQFRPGPCWRNYTGYTWCEYTIMPPDPAPAAVSVLRGDGKRSRFKRSGTNYVSNTDMNDRLEAHYLEDGTTISGWTFISAREERKEKYNSIGKLVAITSRNGMTLRFTYSNGASNDSGQGPIPADAPICPNVQSGAILPTGRLLCVTDHWGRQMQFEYDVKGRVVKTIDPANLETLYSYDGPSGGCLIPGDMSNRACSANNLTKVVFPDGSSKTYSYNEPAQINGGAYCLSTAAYGDRFDKNINVLTGLFDENEVRHISWTYNCSGLATSSVVGSNSKKVTLSYGPGSVPGVATTTVTHYLGTAAAPRTTESSLHYRSVLGLTKNIGASQPCVECGSYALRTYDVNGNLASLTDWNGALTNFAYDMSRNLETSRTEAADTPYARTFTTQWHPNYRLITKRAEPLKTTTLHYDVEGNLEQRTEQATTDPSGVQGLAAAPIGLSRKWIFTYNSVGQVRSSTVPGMGTTLFEYDSQGNLSSVKNALGHLTRFELYDAHGRVGRIIDPNKLETILTYTPRGWLASRTVGGEQWTYEYYKTGQLKLVTAPDQSTLTYTYDDAHQLIGVADNAGNSITFAVDLAGNRTADVVKDPAGALARQTTRVFDSFNRLQQQTGGAQ